MVDLEKWEVWDVDGGVKVFEIEDFCCECLLGGFDDIVLMF